MVYLAVISSSDGIFNLIRNDPIFEKSSVTKSF